jgi:hypothetical protein
VAGVAIAGHRPAFGAADGDHARVLAGAVVLERRGWVAEGSALELVLAASGLLEERANRVELSVVGEVRGGGDRQPARLEVGIRARERQRLQRLRRGAQERHEPGIPCLGDERPAADRRRVDEVRRLDDASAPHDYADGVGHG